MATNVSVRFLNNFIMGITTTTLDPETDEMIVTNRNVHIQRGDIYKLESYELYKDDKIDLRFPSDSPLHGVATRIETDYCELMQPAKPKVAPNGGGCGECGNK